MSAIPARIQERFAAPPVNSTTTTPDPARSRKRIAWVLSFAASLGFIAGGAYAVYRGLDARSEVVAHLVNENIVTPEDASIPNTPVNSYETAVSMANVIQKHALEATGGKTYAEMDREDPLRPVALTASGLRTSLFSAALAIQTANLAIGLGAFIGSVGFLMFVVLLLIRQRIEADVTA